MHPSVDIYVEISISLENMGYINIFTPVEDILLFLPKGKSAGL